MSSFVKYVMSLINDSIAKFVKSQIDLRLRHPIKEASLPIPELTNVIICRALK